jgi:hypothetical protein
MERQQRGHVAHAINADHEGPLDLGGALEEMLAVAGQRAARRHEDERIDRDEDREEPIPLHGDEVVLQRRDDEEGPEQRAVVAGPRGRERDELAQREERHEAEQDHRAQAAGGERDAEDGDHDPPGLHAGVEVGDDLVRVRRAGASGKT